MHLADEDAPRLRLQVVQSSFHGIAAQVVLFASRTITGVLLARMLTRTDFGIAAAATVLLEFVVVLQGMGFRSAVIHKGIDRPGVLQTAFTLQMGIAFLFALTAATVIAPFWGRFYQDPRLVSVVRVMSVVLIVQAIAFLPMTASQARMRFGVVYLSSICGTLAYLCVSVTLAMVYGNYWAIVAGYVVSACVSAIVLLARSREPLRLGFDKSQAHYLIRFGKYMLASDILVCFGHQIDKLLVGRLLSLEELGIYFQAQKWGLMVAISLVAATQSIMFSAYSLRQGNIPAVRRGYLHALFLAFIVVIPSSVVVYLFGDKFVSIVLGYQWVRSVRPMQWFAILSVIRVMNSVTAPLLPALGYPRRTMIVSMVGNTILVISLIIMCPKWGLMGAIGALAVKHTVVQGMLVLMTRRLLALHAGDFFRVFLTALIASIPLIAVGVYLRWVGEGGVMWLTFDLLGCVAVYGVTLLSFFRLNTISEIRKFVLMGPRFIRNA